MDVRGLSHAKRVSEWEQRIHACRTSSLTVARWCEENQICSKTYYRWERICLEEATQRAGCTGDNRDLVRIKPQMLATESMASNSVVTTAAEAEVVIRCGQASFEIRSGISVAGIAELVVALNCHV